MKKLALILFLAIGLTSLAQEKITEGKVTLKQTMSSDNEQVNAQLAMVGDISTTTYFKGNKSRTEVSSPMTGSNITIVDNDLKKGIVLMDNPMMGKMYNETDLNVSEEDLSKIKVEKTTETKEILGYKCTAYKVTMTEQGMEMNMMMYTTEELDIISDQAAKFGDGFKGFPLYMEINMTQQGMAMTITTEATAIDKESVSDEMFSLAVPEGYKKMDVPAGN
ncbi:DUF4412 domain-containing protein [Ichthyenterobacterium sp. W332]|uniref:DUF4412 domain-containing protein n=1 Tax=Microcosmobacter mediterraneus TaxID=3075607 RepID=A0ABU2YN84_9FLAO|nr:DUF4412 domain-containing protein [Ichthyenterobacterium sp. W332]MDT0559625.1 DUF4412 domain-containing protein [Ichthyenterobacterium sp. W332]